MELRLCAFVEKIKEEGASATGSGWQAKTCLSNFSIVDSRVDLYMALTLFLSHPLSLFNSADAVSFCFVADSKHMTTLWVSTSVCDGFIDELKT